MAGKDFNPDRDIPDLSSKVIFVTGGTAGLGRESVLALARHRPEQLYFSGRDSSKAVSLINEIKGEVPDAHVTFVECDLASLTSVEQAAKQFNSQSQRLDVLLCNAGVMALPPGLTKDGYEIQFGTNHVGHALLTKLLLPTMLRTAETPNSDVRIVNLTSLGFRGAPTGGIVFKDLRTTQTKIGLTPVWNRYGQSKLANILYAKELARRYPSITSVSVHPGVASTDLVEKLSPFKKALVYVTNIGNVRTPREVARNQLWAATGEKEQLQSGGFYEPIAVVGRQTKDSKSEKLARELWEWTEKELEGYQV